MVLTQGTNTNTKIVREYFVQRIATNLKIQKKEIIFEKSTND